jgi:hypothetical protein
MSIDVIDSQNVMPDNPKLYFFHTATCGAVPYCSPKTFSQQKSKNLSLKKLNENPTQKHK